MAVDVDTHECVCTELHPRPPCCLSRLPRPYSVVKVILQFCKENQLTQSFAALSSETQARHRVSSVGDPLAALRCAFPGLSARVRASTQVTLNAVDNRDAFLSDVRHGRWDSVLPQARTGKGASALHRSAGRAR
jgi:LisH-like dimerisation domain